MFFTASKSSHDSAPPGQRFAESSVVDSLFVGFLDTMETFHKENVLHFWLIIRQLAESTFATPLLMKHARTIACRIVVDQVISHEWSITEKKLAFQALVPLLSKWNQFVHEVHGEDVAVSWSQTLHPGLLQVLSSVSVASDVQSMASLSLATLLEAESSCSVDSQQQMIARACQLVDESLPSVDAKMAFLRGCVSGWRFSGDAVFASYGESSAATLMTQYALPLALEHVHTPDFTMRMVAVDLLNACVVAFCGALSRNTNAAGYWIQHEMPSKLSDIIWKRWDDVIMAVQHKV